MDLQIRNLGTTVAVSPVPELNAPSNVWPVKSLARQESIAAGGEMVPRSWIHHDPRVEAEILSLKDTALLGR